MGEKLKNSTLSIDDEQIETYNDESSYFTQLIIAKDYSKVLDYVEKLSDDVTLSFSETNLYQVFSLLESPITVLLGLYWHSKLTNKTEEVQEQIDEMAVQFLPMISQHFNPILVSLLWVEVTTRQVKSKYLEAVRKLDLAIEEEFGKDGMYFYTDRYFTGINAITIIVNNNLQSLLDLPVLTRVINHYWHGPYSYEESFLLTEHATMYQLFTYSEFMLNKPLKRQESRPIPFFSLRSGLSGAYQRIILDIIADLVAFIIIFYYVTQIVKTDELAEFYIDLALEVDNPRYPDTPQNLFRLRLITLCYVAIVTLRFFTVNIRNYVMIFPMNWLDATYLLGMGSFFSILYNDHLLQHPEEHSYATELDYIDRAAESIGAWIAFLSFKIFIELKYTKIFGRLVINIQSMTIRLLKFFLILFVLILFFSLFFMTWFYRQYDWSWAIEDTAVYLFHGMLGNYNETDFEFQIYDYEPALVFYLYLFITAIIMLNLLIAVLRDIYEEINKKTTTGFKWQTLVLGQTYSTTSQCMLLNISAPFTGIVALVFPIYFWGWKRASKIEKWIVPIIAITFVTPISVATLLWVDLILIVPTYMHGLTRFMKYKQWKNLWIWLLIGFLKLLWYIILDVWEMIKTTVKLPDDRILAGDVLRESDIKIYTDLPNEDNDYSNLDINSISIQEITLNKSKELDIQLGGCKIRRHLLICPDIIESAIHETISQADSEKPDSDDSRFPSAPIHTLNSF